MGELQHVHNGVGGGIYARGIAQRLGALNDARAVVAPRHPAHDADRVCFVVGIDDDPEARPADIAFDCGLPPRVGDLDVIAQHARICLRALGADRRERTLDVGRIDALFRKEPIDFLLLLLALARKRLVAPAPGRVRIGELIASRRPVGLRQAPMIHQLVVCSLCAARKLQVGLQHRKVAGQVLLHEASQIEIAYLVERPRVLDELATLQLDQVR